MHKPYIYFVFNCNTYRKKSNFVFMKKGLLEGSLNGKRVKI